MSTQKCPSCFSPVPPNAVLCLECGALQTKSLRTPDPEDVDRWRPNPFPPEVVVTVAFILLQFIVLWGFGGTRPLLAADVLLGGLVVAAFVALDLISIFGLIRRSLWGWYLAMALSSFRTAQVLIFLMIPGSRLSSDPAGYLGQMAFIAMMAAPGLLLILSRARGAYLIRLAAETSPAPSAPPRERKT